MKNQKNQMELTDEELSFIEQIEITQLSALDFPIVPVNNIPNLDEKIASMIEKYSKESMDIEDELFADD